MTDKKKSLGQTAYEKFAKAITPENTAGTTWGDLDAVTRGAWEEASEAAVFAFVDTKRMPDGTSTPRADLSRLHAAASWRADRLRPSPPEREAGGAKAMGQIAYEAFHGTYAPQSVPPLEWSEIAETKRAAWDAAAAAVHAQPHRGTVYGPCEMRDYDFITLAVPHRLEYPVDALGFPTRLPAGTRLHMLEPKPGALGVSWETGSANNVGEHPDSPEAQARMADLVAKAKATRESEP